MRGIIVMGPEGSGTGYTRDLLGASGGYLVDWERPHVKHTHIGRPTIVKVSLPNGPHWPLLSELMSFLDTNDPFVVLTSRRLDVHLKQQQRARHVQSESDAMNNIRRAYLHAMFEIARMCVPFILTQYEAFADPEYREFICRTTLGTAALPHLARSHGFIDGNAKYLEEK